MPATAVERVFNFSPGPAVLPLPVLERIQGEMLSVRGSGISILELSHRDDLFLSILDEAIQRLRALLAIPTNYRVLFLQGGSRLQFAMVPLNLAGAPRKCQYIVTGTWGQMAYDEAARLSTASAVWNGKAENFSRLPDRSELEVDPQAAFVHYTSNETIQGVQFPHEPPISGVPLVCDASSDFLWKPLPIDRYGLIYACAQKNAGPAGVTIVIVREDLLERCPETLPGYLNYRHHAAENSLYNTAPTFGIYAVGLVCEWLQTEVGGLDKMQARNEHKAQLLYDVLDQSAGFYQGHAVPNCRSRMNVTFRLRDDSLQKGFLQEAEQLALLGLKGHRSVGGMRASIYNAMPLAGVERLRDHMRDFSRRHG